MLWHLQFDLDLISQRYGFSRQKHRSLMGMLRSVDWSANDQAIKHLISINAIKWEKYNPEFQFDDLNNPYVLVNNF